MGKSCGHWTVGRKVGYPGDPPANTGDARDTRSIPGVEDPLEEEMATHFSVLAWEIPWTEESGRLWSRGSQRVGHN